MDKVNTVRRQRDQVGEGKSLCLRRFSSMCWLDRTSTRSRQNEDLHRYPSHQDAVGLDGEAIEFPKIYNIE